jgi:hypothetical protein
VKVVERDFSTLDRAQGFIDGINFVNDSSINLYELVVEVNTFGRDSLVRFVIILIDQDGDDSDSELVDNEDGEWVRLSSGRTTQVSIKAQK